MDLIRRLHPHYKLAVLSNSPLGFTHWLAEWKIQKLFDVVFCSGDEGVVKPEGTIFIDDTPEHVEAAGRMGLTEIFSQMRPRFGMPWER
jgi:FMN phosphatase YigB (HAD superfamily)